MKTKPLVTKNKFLKTYKLEKFGIKALKKFKFKFPIYPNNNLSKIVSYLTFDGHLSLAKHMFYSSANKITELEEFKNLVKNEFQTSGKIVEVDTSIGTSFKYLIFNNPICRILYLIGTPAGAKVKVPFNVPKWVSENKELSRQYLRVAFDCEGCVWKEGRSFKIRFRLNKANHLIENGLVFMQSLKNMLSKFGISTTNIWTKDCNIRKDGVKTKTMAFNISSKDIYKFKKEIGFKIKKKANILGLYSMGRL